MGTATHEMRASIIMLKVFGQETRYHHSLALARQAKPGRARLFIIFVDAYSSAAASASPTGPSTSCTIAIGAASPGLGPVFRIRR